jgi:hypothetical protein
VVARSNQSPESGNWKLALCLITRCRVYNSQAWVSAEGIKVGIYLDEFQDV